MDEEILLGARGGDLTDLGALHAGDVGAVLHGGASLVVADSALRHLDIHAHRGALDVALHDGLGQLGEVDGIDFHEDLYPSVSGAVRVQVLVQLGVEDHATGTTVVLVLVVHEHGLADERQVALLDLLSGERVVVVVGPRRDGPRADVQVAGAHSHLGEICTVGRASQGVGCER